MSVIKKETESSVSPTYEGYCHEITITLHLDGSVTPKTIPFGNCGDKNITRFSFNVQELIAAVPTLKEDYTFILIFTTPVYQNPLLTRHNIQLQINLFCQVVILKKPVHIYVSFV